MNKTFSHISLALILTAVAAPAALVTVTDFQTNGTDTLAHPYAVSTTDLLNGLAPTAQPGNFVQEGAGGAGVLTDGLFASPITRDLGGAFQFSTFATAGPGGGTSLTYLLGVARNIGSISVYGGWQDSGRDQQSYSIFYSTAAAPGTFLPLTTVNFNPGTTTHPQVTKVSISDTTGILASDVAGLRFDFNATENGYSGYSEIDVFAAVPEPGSIGLLGLAVLGAAAGRRRQQDKPRA